MRLSRLLCLSCPGPCSPPRRPPRRSTRACCASPTSRRRRSPSSTPATSGSSPKQGGVAVRLSSPRGEESFPRFSPDGRTLAFSANYDGNTDVYTVPAQGGDPVASDVAPDDRPRARLASGRHARAVRVVAARAAASATTSSTWSPATGGPAEKLPVPYGEFGSLLARRQAGRLPAAVAGVPHLEALSRRLGARRLDVRPGDARPSANVTTSDANDEHPMWHGDTLYFLSDRGANQRANIWARDKSGAVRQVTQFADFDVTFPAIGPQDIVFEAGGRLYLLEPGDREDERGRRSRSSPIARRSSRAARIGRRADPRGGAVADRQARGLRGARRRLHGAGRARPGDEPHAQLGHRRSAIRAGRRTARRSPTGAIAPASTSSCCGPPTAPAPRRPSRRSARASAIPPQWSPDSTRLAFIDQTETLRLARGRERQARRDRPGADLDGARQPREPAAALVGRLALADVGACRQGDRPTRRSSSTTRRAAKTHQVTSGYFTDVAPVFDPDGKYLYFLSNRAFEPVYSDFDNSWTYPNSTRIVAMALRAGRRLAARRPQRRRGRRQGQGRRTSQGRDKDKDEREAKDEGQEAGRQGRRQGRKAEEGRRRRTTRRRTSRSRSPSTSTGSTRASSSLPPKAGNYNGLAGGLRQGALPPHAAHRLGRARRASIVYYDLEEREEKTVLEGADAFIPTADGKKLFVLADKKFGFVDVKADAEGREGDAHRRAGDDRRSEGRVAPDVRRRVPLPARLLLRPGPARRRLAGAARRATRR